MLYLLEAKQEVQYPQKEGTAKNVNIRDRWSLLTSLLLMLLRKWSLDLFLLVLHIFLLPHLPSLFLLLLLLIQHIYIIMLCKMGEKKCLLVNGWQLHYFVIYLKDITFSNMVNEMRKQALSSGSWFGNTSYALVLLEMAQDSELAQCSSVEQKNFTGHHQIRTSNDLNRTRVKRPLSKLQKWPNIPLFWLIISYCCIFTN